MLQVRGYAEGGFCFMLDDKAVSVHEALLANGGKFHKRTINALNRNNLANEQDLAEFEKLVKVLHTGLDAFNARKVLRDHFNIDVLKIENYYILTSSEIYDLMKVYEICKYKVSVKSPAHSTMYYFFEYLNRKDVRRLERT
ncbi:hypothetical protein FDG95_gp412 [Pectobacterium phage vB_PcaM_CBB]|uniref:Uncharacterized protein n=1 Tax=Pectobacterium phage vB_PcaM_CBB TaxID=2772511 RepID=A0A1L2CU85_9CAUD|nr:hypothetical protein FDG95_gp014 [Pectobacterium phage vB_PcaM_CBB]YP_009595107.1 hypothetical protein FDG95_gp412 [Pectobacterium phage vB_PcaM_CBB]AMM43579.1 hypothetical protein CBB_14 [Pectobacterium phage vB_PcaM_CBB]AMM44130.1 hypothetical protein CBB_567 [Pectobacterium phage vB_PcaM_CBB]